VTLLFSSLACGRPSSKRTAFFSPQDGYFFTAVRTAFLKVETFSKARTRAYGLFSNKHSVFLFSLRIVILISDPSGDRGPFSSCCTGRTCFPPAQNLSLTDTRPDFSADPLTLEPRGHFFEFFSESYSFFSFVKWSFLNRRRTSFFPPHSRFLTSPRYVVHPLRDGGS